MFSRLTQYLSMLTESPLDFIIYIAYLAVTVLFSLILHEVAHGYVALRCGDPTAKWLGRLSLNPAKHLDPLGTICMLVFGFGWAKPVPVNPRNFRNYRRDDFLVSIAGICMNLTLMIVCSFLAVLLNRFIWEPGMLKEFKSVYGSLQGLVNVFANRGNVWAALIAYGSTAEYAMLAEYAVHPWMFYIQRFLLLMVQINASLAVFNLLPIPPLDGYHLVNDTLLKGRFQLDRNTFFIAQTILIALCWSGALSGILSTVCGTLISSVTNLFIMMFGGA